VIASLAAAGLLLAAAIAWRSVLPALVALAAGAGATLSWPASLAGTALGAALLALSRLVWRLIDEE